jgi:hypothetical protein
MNDNKNKSINLPAGIHLIHVPDSNNIYDVTMVHHHITPGSGLPDLLTSFKYFLLGNGYMIDPHKNIEIVGEEEDCGCENCSCKEGE